MSQIHDIQAWIEVETQDFFIVEVTSLVAGWPAHLLDQDACNTILFDKLDLRFHTTPLQPDKIVGVESNRGMSMTSGRSNIHVDRNKLGVREQHKLRPEAPSSTPLALLPKCGGNHPQYIMLLPSLPESCRVNGGESNFIGGTSIVYFESCSDRETDLYLQRDSELGPDGCRVESKIQTAAISSAFTKRPVTQYRSGLKHATESHWSAYMITVYVCVLSLSMTFSLAVSGDAKMPDVRRTGNGLILTPLRVM